MSKGIPRGMDRAPRSADRIEYVTNQEIGSKGKPKKFTGLLLNEKPLNGTVHKGSHTLYISEGKLSPTIPTPPDNEIIITPGKPPAPQSPIDKANNSTPDSFKNHFY